MPKPAGAPEGAKPPVIFQPPKGRSVQVTHLAQEIINQGIGDVGGLTYSQQYELVKQQEGFVWGCLYRMAAAFRKERKLELSADAALESLKVLKASHPEGLTIDSFGVQTLIEKAASTRTEKSLQELQSEWRALRAKPGEIDFDAIVKLMATVRQVQGVYRSLYQDIKGANSASVMFALKTLINDIEDTFGHEKYPIELLQKYALSKPRSYMDAYFYLNQPKTRELWEQVWKEAYKDSEIAMKGITHALDDSFKQEKSLKRIKEIELELDTKFKASSQRMLNDAWNKYKEEEKQLQESLKKLQGEARQPVLAKIKESRGEYEQLHMQLDNYPKIKANRAKKEEELLSLNKRREEYAKTKPNLTPEEIDRERPEYKISIDRLNEEIVRDTLFLEKIQQAFWAKNPEMQALIQEKERLQGEMKLSEKPVTAKMEDVGKKIDDLHKDQFIGRYIQMYVYNEAFALMRGDASLSMDEAIDQVKNDEHIKVTFQYHLMGLGIDLEKHPTWEEEFSNA